MRYRLHTLLIAVAIGPPLLAGVWFVAVWILKDFRLAIAAIATLAVASVFILGILALTATIGWVAVTAADWIVDTTIAFLESKNRR